MIRVATVGILALTLTSCAEYVPIAGDLVGLADDSTIFIKDASIAKEAIVHKTLQERDAAYMVAYQLSGTKIEFEMKEVMPGIYMQTIKSLNSRESPHFRGELPTQPSIHPVWGPVNKGMDLAAKVGMFWIGADFLKDAWSNSAPQYNGPYNSYNQTAEPFIVEPIVITP